MTPHKLFESKLCFPSVDIFTFEYTVTAGLWKMGKISVRGKNCSLIMLVKEEVNVNLDFLMQEKMSSCDRNRRGWPDSRSTECWTGKENSLQSKSKVRGSDGSDGSDGSRLVELLWICRWTGDCNSLVGVNVSVNGCLYLCVSLKMIKDGWRDVCFHPAYCRKMRSLANGEKQQVALFPLLLQRRSLLKELRERKHDDIRLFCFM